MYLKFQNVLQEIADFIFHELDTLYRLQQLHRLNNFGAMTYAQGRMTRRKKIKTFLYSFYFVLI